jgi:hypothetical protein
VTVDGTQYLVVANSGANDVLVYRGLGNGEFDAAGVQTYFAGTDPVGITIADVNQDGTPDVVVANEGSNDVSMFLGQETSSGWSLTPGPRLKAGGVGPVSTTVQDVNGDGIPDLLVTNSQSNNVTLLSGLGGGFFDDQGPRSFSTGASPQEALVGHFESPTTLDLVTINAGSNDVSFFPGFGAGVLIPTGGETPMAALVGDFNGDGLSDVLIAHNGDGQLSLLMGTADGPSLGRTFSSDLHPTAVALAGRTPTRCRST